MSETLVEEKTKVKGLSGTTIKFIAIAAMLIDHIAWAFVPTYSVFGQIMHVIGRITASIMCFFVAEGYYYTKNVKKYVLRLAIFALISHVPFIFFETENSLIISETEFIPKNLDTDYISSEFKSKSAEVYICQGIKDETKEIFLNLGTEVVYNVSIPARDAAVTYLCGKKLGISEMR